MPETDNMGDKTIMKAIGMTVLAVVASVASLHAQEPAGNKADSYQRAAAGVHRQLVEAEKELAALREQIAGEKIPLSRKLSERETELSKVRRDYQQSARLVDSRTLDLANLRSEIKSREEESTYLSNLLNEYVRNFETRLHIAEIQRYEKVIEAARLAPENSNLSEQEIYEAQTALLSLSLDRLFESLGGTRFEGKAVNAAGRLEPGTFVLVGPAALFGSEDGQDVGTAEQRLGSSEPTVIAFEDPTKTDEAANVVTRGQGRFPLDPTLGNAHKIAATQETLWEHVQKGGVVMVPIFALAALALIIALYKWVALSLLRKPSRKQIAALLDDVGRKDQERALEKVRRMKGPVGAMLLKGVEHLEEPRELVEEVMYENVLTTRLELQRMLPFIAICAASAPLLGLLGTVTGIINTFKMITVFGSGDVKNLSGGISEALITTKFGLIVAIPSLVLHAFLSRKARGVIDQMEKAAVALVNRLGKTTPEEADGGRERVDGGSMPPVSDPDLVRLQVRKALDEMLVPAVKENLYEEWARKHDGLRGPGDAGMPPRPDGKWAEGSPGDGSIESRV